jgi:16S rRNA (cytidine1402-2'-O)-methyltransferase
MAGESRGTLYLCATPLGNLEDITLRALRILKEVDLIAAEDTRLTRRLLARYAIHTPLTSYHEHNKKKKGEHLLGLLRLGKQVALVTDAGLPGISDPGEEMVAAAVEEGIRVVPVPGPSAALTALIVSGLPASRFCFEGFLPADAGGREKRLQDLKAERRTLIFYEAPHRLRKTLAAMLSVLGDRRVAVARELTKVHEEVWRGNISAALEYFREPRGEFTLVVEGAAEKAAGREPVSWPAVCREVNFLVAAGMDKREAIKETARKFGLPRREVYRALVEEKAGAGKD